MRIAYLDAFSGVSGDMTVGALLDLGVALERVREVVAALDLHDVDVSSEPVLRGSIAARKFHVHVRGEQVHETGHGAGHAVHRADHHDRHHHPHRAWSDIREQLRASRLEPAVRERALAIFGRLAEAEAHVHGTAVEAVTFHEVGAIDALVDVVAAAAGFVELGIERVHVSTLPLGGGFVHTAHGRLPVPGPAVVELLRGWPVRTGDGETELVTPTGAAIVAALGTAGPAPEFRAERTGYGAGQRTLADRPNVLRMIVGETGAVSGSDTVVVLEASIDDLNPQIYEHVLERLITAGARDAFLAPLVMKKSRPGTLLRVLADPADRDRLAGIVFAETSTIGLRFSTWQRLVLPREERVVETRYGPVRVKIAHAPDGTINISPEYEECRRLALVHAVPLKLVQQEALAAAMAATR